VTHQDEHKERWSTKFFKRELLKCQKRPTKVTVTHQGEHKERGSFFLEKAQKNPKWLRHDCAPRKCKEGVAVHLLNHLLLLPRPPPAPRLAPPLQSGRPPSPSPTPFAAAPRLETHAAAPKCVAGSRRDASTGSAGVDADNPGRG
jgi:hypothetical protein